MLDAEERTFWDDAWNHWKSVAGGGAIAAVGLMLFERYVLQLPWPAYAIVALLFLVQAAYLAWRDQYRKGQTLATEVSTLKAEVTRLAEALNVRRVNRELAELLARKDEWAVNNLWCVRPKDSNCDEFLTWMSARKKWDEEVNALLDQYGCSYLETKHFRTLGNLADEYPTEPYHPDSILNHQFVMLALRRKRLQDIIDSYSG